MSKTRVRTPTSPPERVLMAARLNCARFKCLELFLLGMNWYRLALNSYWRIGKAKAVGLGKLGRRSKEV